MSHNRRLPPLNALRVFDCAARLGNFTRAAESLDMRQPSVSRQVQQLEQFLGVKLFQRFGPSIRLTEAGWRYHQQISELFDQLEQAGDELGEREQQRPLTLSANFGLASYWLMPRLAEYQWANPGAEFNVITTEHETGLRRDGVDIAIRFGDGRWDDGVSQLLIREEVFPVCTLEYLQRAPPLSCTADLLDHTLICVEPKGARWYGWHAWLQSQGVGGQFRAVHFNNYTLGVDAALRGRGLILGWSQVLAEQLDSGSLLRPLAEAVSSERGYYAVLDYRIARSGVAGGLVEHLTATGGS